MENDQDTRLHAYLNQEMSPEDRLAFEKELAQDSALRTKWERCKVIDKATQAYSKHYFQDMVAEARRKAEPLGDPAITRWDRIRFFWYAHSRAIVVAGGAMLLVIIAWIAINLTLCPVTSRVSDYFIAPNVIHVRAGNVADYNLAEKASRFYEQGQLDSLLSMTAQGEVPPRYYLAHWYLRQERYREATAAFNQLLTDQEALRAYAEFQDIGALKFNLLLARLGETGDESMALSELAALRQDPDAVGVRVNERIAALTADLENPLRRFACIN